MKRTPLYDWHVSAGARMIDFGGWEMPLQYTSIADEHIAVRNRVGMFDVSHMGDIVVSGKGAQELVRRLMTNDPGKLIVGKGIYGHILDDDGKIIDDTIVYRIGEESYLLVPNASRTGVVLQWMQGHADGQKLTNLTDEIACLAIQGPKAEVIMEQLTGLDLSSLKKFHFIMTSLISADSSKEVAASTSSYPSGPKVDKEAKGEDAWPTGPFGDLIMLSRTGYTGEDGFEVLCDYRSAVSIWKRIIEAGRTYGMLPAGLGARDSLRLEMGYLLSGTDFDGSQSTVQTGPDWVIKWDHEFIGREALRRDAGLELPRLVALLLDDRGIPRHGHTLLREGQDVGHVTSGTISPCLKKGIALGYVRPDLTGRGTALTVAIRDMRVPAHVVRPPFVRK